MDASIIIFDMNMKEKDLALKALMKISCKKLLSDAKDVTKLILFNTQDTDNYMNSRYGGYEHIYECSDQMIKYNPELFYEQIQRAEPTDEGNWVEALTVGVNRVLDDLTSIAKVTSYQLLFITDFGKEVTDYSEDRFQSIIDEINTHSICLYVLGPHIPVPFPIQEHNDVKLWMSETVFPEHETNLSLFKRILDETSTSLVCDLKIGVHLFSSFKHQNGSRPWNKPLAIGSTIEMPAQTYRILREGLVCKLKSTKRTNTVMVWVDCEDETVEYPFEEIKNGVTRHDRFVEIPDPNMFKCENPAGFNILCFTDNHNVPEYFMRGEGSYFVFPNGTEEENEAMNMLIDYLAHHEKYVIARRVYANNFRPSFVVLVPCPDHDPRCFIYAELPCADDMKVPEYKEIDPKSVPRVAVDGKIRELLSEIDADNPENLKTMPLSVMMMGDRNTERIVNKAADKIMERELNLKDCDLDYVDGLVVSKSEAVKEMWPKRDAEKLKIEKDENESGDEDYDWS